MDDLIEAFLLLMDTPDDFHWANNYRQSRRVYHPQMAEKVIRMTGAKSEIIYKQLPSDDPRQRKADISLAKAKLGWASTIFLEEGLERTIAYFADLATR